MKSTTTIRWLAIAVGVFIIGLGVIGVVSPAGFFGMVAFMQEPPAIWVAAVVRIFTGAVLVLAATASRKKWVFWILGFPILIGGIATLFVGQQMGHALLDQWRAGGEGVVRASSVVSIGLGAFIVWSAARGSEGL